MARPTRSDEPQNGRRPKATLFLAQNLERELGAESFRRLMMKALREIAGAGRGLDLWYHPFEFDGLGFALATRWREAGLRLEIEIDRRPEGLPRITLDPPRRTARGRGFG